MQIYYITNVCIIGSAIPTIDSMCQQTSSNPVSFAITAVLSGVAPTNINCIDTSTNQTVNGALSRDCINGSHNSFTFEYSVPRTPYEVSCSISNGPVTTVRASARCFVSSSKYLSYAMIHVIFNNVQVLHFFLHYLPLVRYTV